MAVAAVLLKPKSTLKMSNTAKRPKWHQTEETAAPDTNWSNIANIGMNPNFTSSVVVAWRIALSYVAAHVNVVAFVDSYIVAMHFEAMIGNEKSIVRCHVPRAVHHIPPHTICKECSQTESVIVGTRCHMLAECFHSPAALSPAFHPQLPTYTNTLSLSHSLFVSSPTFGIQNTRE